MKRFVFLTLLVSTLMPKLCLAERLEVGLAMTPTFIHDEAFEAFAEDAEGSFRIGGDIRSEVGAIKGFGFLPVLGYRGARNEGYPHNIVDTELAVHDFFLGLRVRKGLLSWLSVFVEASGGLVLAVMDAELSNDYSVGSSSASKYDDTQLTWQAGGLLGVEFHLSKRWLESRGVRNFGFGGEIGGGYMGRGNLSFDPDIEGGDDTAIDTETLGSWGEVNLSGWVIQLGLGFRFF